jgi:AcrR family transcriptional regulator
VAPSPAPRQKTTNGRGDRTREAILRAAQRQFADRGYRGASLASIAEEAGISEPGLVHHFSSKPALLQAVLARRDDEDGRLFLESLGTRGLDTVEAFETIVAHNQSAPEGVRLYSVLLGESLEVDHPAHDHFVARYDYARHYVSRGLDERMAGRLPEDVDVETLASILIAVMDGLQYQWLLDSSIDMVESYRVVARLVAAALGPDQTPHNTAEPATPTNGLGHRSDAAEDSGSDSIGASAAT